MGEATRRTFLATAAATSFASHRWAGTAFAQTSGADALQLLVPASPGGGWDRLAQVIAQVLPETGAVSRVNIQNLPGAGGTLALARLVTSLRGQPNCLMIGGLTLVSSPIVHESAVTVLDTTPIARLEGEPLVLAVAVNSPLRTIGDFARSLRADPSGVRVAGGSEGSADHILLALIGQALAVDPFELSYVPFSGGGPAARAVMDGRARAGISNWSEFAPEIAAGPMRALALSGDARYVGVDVPTLREGGIDVVLYNWNGVFAPPGIDAEQRTNLERMIETMVRSGAWEREAAQQRWQLRYLPQPEFGAFLRTEARSTERVLARLGLTMPRRIE